MSTKPKMANNNTTDDESLPPSPPSPLHATTNSSMDTCAICLMSMIPGQGQAMFTAECSHSFHFNCITSNVKHGNHICPVCRAIWKQIPFDTSNSVNTSRRNSPVPHSLVPSVFDDDEVTVNQPEVVDQTNGSNFSFEAIELKTVPEVSAVSKTASHKNFNILVHLKALTRSQVSCVPIDLVTVLDVSGSMSGPKLALLKQAMEFVIQKLGPSDRLSVVVFNHNAHRIFPLRLMTDAGKQAALQTVNVLTASGSTSILNGLNMGVQVLTDRRWKNPVVSIILLSDGQDNYMSEEQERNYQALLPLAAQSDSGDGLRIPVHTFGFGTDHDAAAMNSISESSGGTFSFIENEYGIQDAFAQCLGGILSVAIQKLEVRVKCVDPKIQLGSIKAGRYKPHMTEDSRKAKVNVGDMYNEEERDFLVTVDIPVDSSGNEMSLLKIKCVYRDPITGNTVKYEDSNVLKIQRPEIAGDLVVSIEVDRHRNRLRAAEVMAEAKAKADQGDFSGAVSTLESFHCTLMESESAKAQDPLCIGLAADIRAMQDRMGNQNTYGASGRAFLLSGIFSHSTQRATSTGLGIEGECLFGSAAYQTEDMSRMITNSRDFSESKKVIEENTE